MVLPFVSFVVGLAFIPVALRLAEVFGLYAVVGERQAQVFTLFGKVLGVLDEPGLRFPVARFGLRAFLVPFFGRRQVVSTALRQHYLRSQMVNSEEGTPMGVGIWYEMRVSAPVSYLFVNANPEGSLQANVASSTISTLSNLEMEDRAQFIAPTSRSGGKPRPGPSGSGCGDSPASSFIGSGARVDLLPKGASMLVQIGDGR